MHLDQKAKLQTVITSAIHRTCVQLFMMVYLASRAQRVNPPHPGQRVVHPPDRGQANADKVIIVHSRPKHEDAYGFGAAL